MPLHTMKKDIALIAELLSAAEREALAAGEASPGAEHLLIAALESSDPAARHALGLAGPALREAIAAVHAEALATIGVVGGGVLQAREATSRIYRSAESAQIVFARAKALAKTSARGLSSAHIAAAALDDEQGVVARALGWLGLDRGSLRTAAIAAAS